MKIVVSDSVVGLEAFADFYRYPADRTQPAPLVVWVGGAISLEIYEQRRITEPVEILAEFAIARSSMGDPPSDLLILSCPPTLQGRASDLDLFHQHLDFEIFPLLPPPHPIVIGLVGNSLGAYFATGFACRRPDLRALATIAGVGLWKAIAETGGGLRLDLPFRCYANKEDFAGAYAHELRNELTARGRALDLVQREGDHPFADYAANGSISEAFEFVLHFGTTRTSIVEGPQSKMRST